MIDDLEETYQQLREQLLRGELGEEEFADEVQRLRFVDELGQQWKLGCYTGQWYRYDQGQWVRDQPREQETPTPMAAAATLPFGRDRRVGRQSAYWLVSLLVGLLLVAGALLIIGWAAGWWGGASESVAGVTTTVVAIETFVPATETPRPTVTPLASPTSASRTTPTPGRPVQPTVTHPAPPSSPAHTATQTPSPTPTPTPPTGLTRTPRPSPTALPSLAGTIFFPVFDPNRDRRTFDLFAVRLQDGKRELIVGQASQPALSPDGKRLAYRSWDSAQRGIMVRELIDGHSWLWIKFGEAARPSWSPDSQNIVFPSQQESDRKWRIYRTLGIESDRVRRHGVDILGRVPIWLADGRIVYWECPLGKCGLHVMKGDGTNPLRLTTGEHDTSPSASPDGSQVAFMSDRDGNWEIYVISTHPQSDQEQEVRRLTKGSARDGLPVWSPDGQWLAFVSDRDGAWAVWVMRPDGSAQQKVFGLGGSLEGEIANIPPAEQTGWTWETIAWGP